MAGRKSKISKKVFFCFPLVLFLFILSLGDALSQPVPKKETESQIRLGNVTFKIREIELTPSNLRILEIYIEIFNQSQENVPPHSIKVALVTKEVKFSSENPGETIAPSLEETTLSVPLPPRSGRIQMFGLEIPKGKPESITFEVQLNPPDGEKKTVSFNF